MPRTLTAADRSALIRLAATLDKGSPERKAILAGLEKSAYGWSRSEKELGRKAMAELELTPAQMYALLDSMGAMRDYNRSLRDGKKPMKGKRDWLAMSMTDGLVRPLGRKTLGRFYDIVYGDRKRQAGLEKSASLLMGIQQIIGKLVNDRTLKAHRPTQVITKNPPQGQITLRGIRDNLTITVGQNEDGLGYFAVGKKDGKTHVFVSSRRPIPLGGAIQKVTRPIIEAVKEWEAGQEPLFKAGSSKEEKYVQLFRDLADKRRKTIQVDLKGVMGGSTNGLREFKRGRMGRPKRWRGGRKGPFERVSLSIVPLDDQGNPIKMRSGYKLWLSEYDDGTADVSASIGDMAIMINDMKA